MLTAAASVDGAGESVPSSTTGTAPFLSPGLLRKVRGEMGHPWAL